MTHPSILVVGAAGDLGHRVVEALLANSGAPRVRAAIREGTGGKHAQQGRLWANRGIDVVDADLDLLDSLKRACEGVHTVISTVQGGPDTIIGGQSRLLDAARSAGIARFVPSDFSENLFAIPEGINPYLDWRRTFDRTLQTSGVGYTHILNGGFMEAVFSSPGLIDANAGTISYWGDGSVPLDFTSMDDVAAFAAAITSDGATLNRRVEIAGASRTIEEIANDYELASGSILKRVHRGSIEDGYSELARMKSRGATQMELLPMQYLLPMMSGEGRLHDLRNGDYPTIEPSSLRDFIAAKNGRNSDASAR